VASQLIQEVTAHAQSDSLEDAREICADGTYFPNNLRIIILWDHRRICGPSLSETSLCAAYLYPIQCLFLRQKYHMKCLGFKNVPQQRNMLKPVRYFFLISSGKRTAEFVWNISGSATATGDFYCVSMLPLASIFPRSACSSISFHAGP